MEPKVSTSIGILIIFLVLLPSVYYVYIKWNSFDQEIGSFSSARIQAKKDFTELEKKQIDEWIKKNNLNQYGDPIDTVYPQGDPLYDELTGQKIDRYQYIYNHHKDRPWRE